MLIRGKWYKPILLSSIPNMHAMQKTQQLIMSFTKKIFLPQLFITSINRGSIEIDTLVDQARYRRV